MILDELVEVKRNNLLDVLTENTRMIVNESFKDNIHNLRKTKINRTDSNKYHSLTNMTFEGIPISVSKFDNERFNVMVEAEMKAYLKILNKNWNTIKKEIDRDVEGYIKGWYGDGEISLSQMKKYMKLDYVQFYPQFESQRRAWDKFSWPIKGKDFKTDDEYRDAVKARNIAAKEFVDKYVHDAIMDGSFEIWFNNSYHPDEFFGGHSLTVNVTIKGGKIIDTNINLEG